MSHFTFSPVIPAGEIILVTGVNGYIGAHVADQILAAGYRVRGTVRNFERALWIHEEFERKYGKAKFELVRVEHINEEGAFDKAMKGVPGIAHVATDMSPSGEPEPYISTAIDGMRAFLRSAKQEPKVKRVVFTSSSMAAAQSSPDVEVTIGVDSYNEHAIKAAFEPPFHQGKIPMVYAASKALSEQEAFKWVAEEKPHFVFNTVLPTANFGASLSGELQSTGAWVKMVYDGDYSIIQHVPPQYFIDVVDTAKLHLGALIHPEIEGERLFGFGGRYNCTTVLEVIKKIYPERQFPDGLTGLGNDLSRPPNDRALFFLKSLGVDGYKSLEQSVRETLEGSLPK